jgi:hypothetical protein
VTVHDVAVLRAGGTGQVFRVNCSCGDGCSPKGTEEERDQFVDMWIAQHAYLHGEVLVGGTLRHSAGP